MTTSSVTTFNLDLNNIVEEAFERCGAELRSGYDMRTARRSLNILMIEWANRGINLWTIEQGQINLVNGQISYAIPTDTVDLLDHVVRTVLRLTSKILISAVSQSLRTQPCLTRTLVVARYKFGSIDRLGSLGLLQILRYQQV
jgi:hypothetical protein